MKRYRYAFLLVICALCGATAVRAQPFTEVTALIPPQIDTNKLASITPGDADGDGDYDLLVRYLESTGGLFDDHLSILRNDVDGQGEEWLFTEEPLLATEDVDVEAFYLGDELAWADYDNDGDLDIFAGFADRASLLLSNDGGSFTIDEELPPYPEDWNWAFDLQTASWADYDNDGDLDLLVPRAVVGADTAAVLFENSPNGFVDSGVELPAMIEGQTQWADYDNDGDLDLLMVQPSFDHHSIETAFTRIYRNDGGTLTEANEDLVAFHVAGTASWSDYDNDGDLDVIAVGDTVRVTAEGGYYGQGITARVYRNDGGALTRIDPFLAEDLEEFHELFGATAADYDSDGDTDLLITGRKEEDGVHSSISRIFRNDGGMFVATDAEVPAPTQPSDGIILWADLDGDGDLDHVATGPYPSGPSTDTYDFKLYRNDAPGTNAPPLAAENLEVTVSGSVVQFAWSQAEDDHTPSTGLTYNLWVRTLMGSDVVSPMSRQSGERLLPEPGNVSHNTSWTYTLPPGEYEWRVQAVDNAFNGGAFAEGGTFTVGATTDTEGGTSVPAAFAVGAAFPNPLRAMGTLRVDLPATADVSVTLYDVLGREVLAVPAETMAAGAAQEVAFDVRSLPSGVYLYRVEAALPDRTERASGRFTVVR